MLHRHNNKASTKKALSDEKAFLQRKIIS